MATKRELKKFIRNTCGAIASEMLLARMAFPEIDRKKTYDIIKKVAALQSGMLGKVNVSFDKVPSGFGNDAEYAAARRTYYKKAYGKLTEEFRASVREIVSDMNAALPESVRAVFKDVAGE